MWWLAVVGVLYFFRGKIAPVAARFLPNLPQQTIIFYGQFMMLVAAVVYALPFQFVGMGMLKRPAYMLSMWSAVLTSMYIIKTNYGVPPIPQNLSWSNWKEVIATTLQPWLEKALMSPEFQFLFFALIFLTAYPSIWVLAILGRRALWSVAATCTKNESKSMLWLTFQPHWAKLKAKEEQVQIYSALAEVVLGLWLVISLALPTRQVLVCILYWNYLRTRYQAQEQQQRLNAKKSNLHAKAWETLYIQAQPVLKILPFAQKGIDMAKNWFQPQYRQG